MRQGEILGLRWKDVDMDNQTIYIRQTLTQEAELKAGAKIIVAFALFIFLIN